MSKYLFIADLTLTSDEWKRGIRFSMKEAASCEMYTFRSAWKDYLQRVPPVSFRQTRNFMMAVIAEGRNFDRDDTLQDAKMRICPVLCSIQGEEIG